MRDDLEHGHECLRERLKVVQTRHRAKQLKRDRRREDDERDREDDEAAELLARAHDLVDEVLSNFTNAFYGLYIYIYIMYYTLIHYVFLRN